ncbi:GNAT family N-acetyltransferase [uncultured Pseudoteredinibacter sp.]|uniref:GNAT family N-acetyltransferase n=1 Tax=uncultured Pseudoteredinibacter sp. TaxID=1641701 RepID=UPI002632F76E|nr:GNAT family N-acetyltransferase [uncultured Pseudoteredinibacter sp.]
MITHLKQQSMGIALAIHEVFQASYKIEAELIGADNFPPLSRSVQDIAHSSSMFYGYYADGEIAGVIELAQLNDQLDINSLVVSPEHFRKGIAGKLIEHALTQFSYDEAVVETATANKPAIQLYQKHGFVKFKQWVPDHGVTKTALVRRSDKSREQQK